MRCCGERYLDSYSPTQNVSCASSCDQAQARTPLLKGKQLKGVQKRTKPNKNTRTQTACSLQTPFIDSAPAEMRTRSSNKNVQAPAARSFNPSNFNSPPGRRNTRAYNRNIKLEPVRQPTPTLEEPKQPLLPQGQKRKREPDHKIPAKRRRHHRQLTPEPAITRLSRANLEAHARLTSLGTFSNMSQKRQKSVSEQSSTTDAPSQSTHKSSISLTD